VTFIAIFFTWSAWQIGQFTKITLNILNVCQYLLAIFHYIFPNTSFWSVPFICQWYLNKKINTVEIIRAAKIVRVGIVKIFIFVAV